MIRKLIGGLFVLLLAGLLVLPVLGQPTEEEIQLAIANGVAWVVEQQEANGCWRAYPPPSDGEIIATTGFAVLKLADYGYEIAEDDPTVDGPFDPDYIYHGAFLAGLEYILEAADTYDPDPLTADEICYSIPGHETYNTALALMAIAGARNAAYTHAGANLLTNGRTLGEITSMIAKYFENGQNADGGWRYWYNDDPSDNSNTGFVVLALRYAEALGCDVDSVKVALSGWLDIIQNQPGVADDGFEFDPDGGSGYTIASDWVNVLKTGNLLFEFAFVGDDVSNTRVQAAVDYIQRHWNDPGVGILDEGWKPASYLAMYCLMKGFEAYQIEEILVGSPAVVVDWFAEMAEAIVSTQEADGSWPTSSWDYTANGLWSTLWALLTLEKTTPPPPVLIDIKPGSFPNSINPDQNGKIPVAILSNEAFDATSEVDPTTLTFGHTGDEDSLAYRGKKNPRPQVGYEDVNGDGLLDLVAHFAAQDCGFIHGDEIGYLKGTKTSGEEFTACDSVRTVPPHGTADIDALPMEIATGLSVSVAPSPIRDVHTSYFELVGPMAVEVGQLQVKVFDLSGALVWEQISVGAEIAWHTDDLHGRFLANGIYVYQVLAEVEGNWISVAVDKIAILR